MLLLKNPIFSSSHQLIFLLKTSLVFCPTLLSQILSLMKHPWTTPPLAHPPTFYSHIFLSSYPHRLSPALCFSLNPPCWKTFSNFTFRASFSHIPLLKNLPPTPQIKWIIIIKNNPSIPDGQHVCRWDKPKINWNKKAIKLMSLGPKRGLKICMLVDPAFRSMHSHSNAQLTHSKEGSIMLYYIIFIFNFWIE